MNLPDCSVKTSCGINLEYKRGNRVGIIWIIKEQNLRGSQERILFRLDCFLCVQEFLEDKEEYKLSCINKEADARQLSVACREGRMGSVNTLSGEADTFSRISCWRRSFSLARRARSSMISELFSVRDSS